MKYGKNNRGLGSNKQYFLEMCFLDIRNCSVFKNQLSNKKTKIFMVF